MTSIEGIPVVTESMSYRSNQSTQDRVQEIEACVAFQKHYIAENKGEIKKLKNELTALRVFPNEDDRAGYVRELQERIQERQRDIEQRTRDDFGVMEVTTVNLRDRPSGLVGVLAEMVKIRPCPQALAVRDALSFAVEPKLSAVSVAGCHTAWLVFKLAVA